MEGWKGNPDFTDCVRPVCQPAAFGLKWNKVFPMQGLHLTADLTQCQCDAGWLTDANRLLRQCMHAVVNAGLQPVGQLAHTFQNADQSPSDGPSGVTATVLLAESHLCVHTWPELAAVTLDVYVCNYGGDHSAKAQQLMNALVHLFEPQIVDRQTLHRGRDHRASAK